MGFYSGINSYEIDDYFSNVPLDFNQYQNNTILKREVEEIIRNNSE
jgi:hypothetical protein